MRIISFRDEKHKVVPHQLHLDFASVNLQEIAKLDVNEGVFQFECTHPSVREYTSTPGHVEERRSSSRGGSKCLPR